MGRKNRQRKRKKNPFVSKFFLHTIFPHFLISPISYFDLIPFIFSLTRTLATGRLTVHKLRNKLYYSNIIFSSFFFTWKAFCISPRAFLEVCLVVVLQEDWEAKVVQRFWIWLGRTYSFFLQYHERIIKGLKNLMLPYLKDHFINFFL